MGDGGVACISLQQHTNIMERFPDKAAAAGASHCTNNNNAVAMGVNGSAGGKPTPVAVAAATSNVGVSDNGNGVKSATGNGVGSKTKKVVKRIVKVKKVVTVRKAVQEKGGKWVESRLNLAAGSRVQGSKDEVEEGELGTLKSPVRGEAENGEFGLREKQRKSEVERGDFNGERWRKGGVEKGETVPGKFLQTGELARSAGEDYDRELVLDRWQSKGEFGYSKSRGRFEASRDHTPPSGKCSSEEGFRRKEFSRSGSSHSRNTLRWDNGLDRSNGRIDSRIVDEEGSYKNEYSNGKNLVRELPLGNRLKRLGSDSGGIERKRFGDYIGSKSRRVGEDGKCSAQFEHYPEEKFFKSSSSSFRLLLLDKYYPRTREPTLSSKVVDERHGQSASHVERSPAEKAQYYDLRDQTPLHCGRSPYGRERSPYGGERMPCSRQRSPYARERTPYGYEKGERNPYGRERSPYGGERAHYGRERSPYRREKTSHGHERSPCGGERTPFGRERSPYGERTHYGCDRSPYGGERPVFSCERSPYGREMSPYGHGRSPYEHEKSPHERRRRNEHRARSPVHTERSRTSPVYSETSPVDWAQQRSHRDQTLNYLEHSPLDGSRSDGPRQASWKHGGNQKRMSQRATEGHKDNIIDNKDSNGKDLQVPDEESQDTGKALEPSGAEEKVPICQSHEDEQSQIPYVDVKESPHTEGPPPEELQSMEEDMDICDTPPHVPAMEDSSMGKWYYHDYYGVEQGPARLCDLKSLVDDGVLFSDHFIKHLDRDRWVTIENAVSPLVTVSFPSIVPDSVTRLVSPPEALGNLLADEGDFEQPTIQTRNEVPATSLLPKVYPCDRETCLEPSEDLQIDERVGALLGGLTVTPGKELETIGEALRMTFEHVQLDEWGKSEGFIWQPVFASAHKDDVESLRCSDMKVKEDVEEHLCATYDPDPGFASSFEAADWFSSQWSCKGGDWKRHDDSVQDRFATRKLVLNDGFPLCQMPKAGFEDPRWPIKDDLYYPSQNRSLDLPLWAFSSQEDANDSVTRSSLTKLPIVRGAKGTMLSVVRINACVVKDHGSIVSESHTKVRGKDRRSSRSTRIYSAVNDAKRAALEGDFQYKSVDDQEPNCLWKFNVPISIPKDRICTVHDLQLHLGDWYYLDGAGHEQGPHSYSELQAMVDQGFIQNYSSIFRKSDKLWIPVTSEAETSESMVKYKVPNAASLDDSSRTYSYVANDETGTSPSLFHSLHPQFIGYTHGKLHELVMKAYKSREFAAAINEVLDPWISAKLPKETEKHIFLKSEMDARASKRACLVLDESDEDHELDVDLHMLQDKISTFEELCADTAFVGDETACSETEMGSWGWLDGQILARVFHFLRSDMKSLAFASLTCKRWRSAVGFYKGISRQVDFSSAGSACTDSMIWNIMNCYDRQKISTLVLVGCTNITSRMLEQIVRAFPYLSTIDVRGCSQFVELARQFPNLRWLWSCSFRGARNSEESQFKMKSVKQSSEISTAYKSKGLGGDVDDFGELKEYFESVNKRDSANQLFRRSLYKRSKLFNARKSSSILSRDARMRQWAMKKSEIEYKRMEGFLTSGLKDIMKENSFDFFAPKVAEIEQRMKNGYYVDHGLRSVQDDIRRMCRNAFKAKNHGAGEMNRIVDLFLKLSSHLAKSSKFSYERDELMKSWKDDVSAGLGSTSMMKYKKKSTAERRHMNRSSSSLHRKSRDSDSDTSSDFDRSFLGLDSESTSDTESDLEFQSEGRTRDLQGDGYFTADESLYSATDEREWGARMTKASMVPPVTRKYEVIDQYVIVADEEEVQRKMSVSLPDDYAEKLDAQKNGTEELDMELPEVKEYKPRKQLGDQVLEQEVYGIDPFTHNLLLDSMPEELDLPLSEKHLFIEDVLLRTLNKQVRHFTGTGNTPMMYPLQSVIEEIEKGAEEISDIRTIKICRGLLKAIDSRSDDRYVAYRKGLGVVCNKKGGFREEDFVVEFLGEVYPAWKWFEKQDGVRSLQKDSKDPAPEFYNIYLERPKGDADGYDLVVVDAMHKANYASRICHSCRPNCEAKVTAVDGRYQIGIYTVREIQYGEEITFDYNSVTESKEEYEVSVCLCGSQVCRGSYLNLTGEGAFEKVLEEWHGVLDRYRLMVEACAVNAVPEEDYIDLGRAGLGSCLLGGLPDWVVAYSASLVRFINLERMKLPEEILKYNLEEKQKYFSDICIEVERSDAEVQAEGVYNQRLQNLAVTLDKVRYVMRCVFGDPKKAPPPLEKLSPEETVSFLWKGEGSIVEELLQCMAPHMEAGMLNNLKSKIRAHDPSDNDDLHRALRRSLLWLRDELRSLPCTYKCRHDAAADLIHVYAYTKFFFRIRKYETFTSPPVYISPLDLGPKYTDKLGPGNHEYRKTYGEKYCLGQLIFWHIQTNTKPDCSLDRASRGCLSLPDIGSFYTKVQKPSQQRIYGPKTLKVMVDRMVKYPQKPWPMDRSCSFKSSPDVFGSPMLDSLLKNCSVDKDMVHWLKQRPSVFQHMWDE